MAEYTDIKVIDEGNGGDIVQGTPQGFAMTAGFENMVYLGLFGGNVAESNQESQINTDWWGNDLLMPEENKKQFKAETEKLLQETPLNSTGRIRVEEAAKRDLEFMQAFANLSVNVSIADSDTVRIGVIVREPEQLTNKRFQFVWNRTEERLIFKEQ